MLAAVNPVPATPLQLAPAFAAGLGVLTIGRVAENVVSAIRLNEAAPAQLPDKLVNMVSRRHARLEVVAGQLELADLGAVNGTYVNDARIEPNSRRVLQENDVISFGGPTTIVTRGQARPNPWVWRVRQLQQFLASYVPPSQAPPPAQQAAAAAAAAVAPAPGAPAREVFSFSPAPRAGGQAAAAALPPGAIVVAPPQEEEEVVSPEQAAAPGGNTQPGSIPLSGQAPLASGSPAAAAEPAAAPAGARGGGPPPAAEGPAAGQQLGTAALLDDDSDESAELAALAAYEAYVASQQASTPQAGAAGQAAQAQAAQQCTQVIAQQQAPQQQAQAAQQHAHVAQQPAHMAQQQATVQPQVQRAHQVQVLPPHGDDDIVDLTADSPEAVPPGRPWAGGGGGAAGGDRGAGGAAAAAAAAGGAADVVDLLDGSPTKRRHGGEVDQGAKRARPSPEARPPLPAAAVGRAPVPADSNGAGPSAPAAGGAVEPASLLSDLHEAAPICAICQELPVVTHAMVPCGHSFCGECLAEWLSKKTDCPTCRKPGEAAPLRNHDMDRMIELLVTLSARGAGPLSVDDLEARKERVASWEARRGELEGKLAAPWARGGRGGGGRGDAAGGGAYGGMLSALAASILGGGGLGGFGVVGGDPLLGLAHGPGLGPPPPPRRTPQVVPPRPAAAPPQYEYRAEVTPHGTTARCAACNAAFAEMATRIGQRPQAQARGGHAAYRWYHLGCLPARSWHEARVRGVSNLRNLPPAHASRVREHMQLADAPAQPAGRRRYAG